MEKVYSNSGYSSEKRAAFFLSIASRWYFARSLKREMLAFVMSKAISIYERLQTGVAETTPTTRAVAIS